jgi:hypothetical protein
MQAHTRVLVLVVALAGLGCTTGAGGDARVDRQTRSYQHSQMDFAPLFQTVLRTSWEVLEQDLGARVVRLSFDPLRPPAPTGQGFAEHWIEGRIADLEQLGDVELEVRVSAPRLVDVEVGESAVEVQLIVRTSADPSFDSAVAEDRDFVERSFWESLDARLEDRLGFGLRAGRIRSGL